MEELDLVAKGNGIPMPLKSEK